VKIASWPGTLFFIFPLLHPGNGSSSKDTSMKNKLPDPKVPHQGSRANVSMFEIPKPGFSPVKDVTFKAKFAEMNQQSSLKGRRLKGKKMRCSFF